MQINVQSKLKRKEVELCHVIFSSEDKGKRDKKKKGVHITIHKKFEQSVFNHIPYLFQNELFYFYSYFHFTMQNLHLLEFLAEASAKNSKKKS